MRILFSACYPYGSDYNDPAYPIHTFGYYNDECSVAHVRGKMGVTERDKAQIEEAIKKSKENEKENEKEKKTFTEDHLQALSAILSCFQNEPYDFMKNSIEVPKAKSSPTKKATKQSTGKQTQV